MSQPEVTITYLGHSGFLLEDGNTNLVLDPGKKTDPSKEKYSHILRRIVMSQELKIRLKFTTS